MTKHNTTSEHPTVLTPGEDPATQLAHLKDHVVAACDLVSESLASIVAQEDGDFLDVEAIRRNLAETLLELWRIRWECYVPGGSVRVGGAS